MRAREAAAMLATARWMYRSALARTETRGMHKRHDHPQQDPAQRAATSRGGLDEVQVEARPAPASPPEALARMIELVSPERCIACEHLRATCARPTSSTPSTDAPPMIARQDGLPDLLHVRAVLPGRRALTWRRMCSKRCGVSRSELLRDQGLLGSYRASIGWSRGKRNPSRQRSDIQNVSAPH